MNNESLLALRSQIDAIDLHIISLLAKRKSLAIDIAYSKMSSNKPIRDINREHELLSSLIKEGKKQGINGFYITRLFKIIIEDAVLTQQALLQLDLNNQVHHSTKIAFLGPIGSYSHLAVRQYATRYFKKIIECCCQNFSEVLNFIEHNQAEYGVLPIENSSSGTINEVYDLLQQTNLFLIGEIIIPIDHCLLVSCNTNIDKIEVVYSHPQPFQQCSKFLSRFPNWKLKYCKSTAVAMEKIAHLDDPNIAAIGNAQGGVLYGLNILESNLANKQNNATRFIILANKPIDVAEQIMAKTSIIIINKKQPNVLSEVLLVLRIYNIIIIHLESRVLNSSSHEEIFYIDLKANLRDLKVQKALNKIKKLTISLKILGCYPSENII